MAEDYSGAIVDDVAAPNTQSAQTLADLAAHHCRLGQYDAAKPLLEKALDTAVALCGDDTAGLLPILDQLVRVYLQLGELKKALKCSERALKITETVFGSQSVKLAAPLDALVTIHFALGSLDKCYQAAERGLTILQAALGDDSVEVAMARDRLGFALAEMGAYDRARELHLRALAVLRASGRSEAIAVTLANVAGTYLAVRDFESARPLYEEALATARSASGAERGGVANYLRLLGDYWVKAGDDARALCEYREALAIRRKALGELHPDVAQLLFKIGSTEYRKDKAAGRQTLLEAIAVLDVRLHRPHLFAEICSFLARAQAPSPAAAFFWKLAVNEIESLRTHVARLDGVLERSFLKQNSDDFRALGDTLIALGRLPEAQHVLTMLKEHELFGLVRIDVRKTRVPLTALEAHWVRRGWRLLRRIHPSLQNQPGPQFAAAERGVSLRSKIEEVAKKLNAEFELLVADFAAAEGQPDRQVSVPAAASPKNQIPPPGTVLLQYVLMPDHRNMSIILTTSGLQREYRLLFGEGELNNLVYTMREGLQNRSDRFLPSAQRLYGMLVAPMAEMLKAANATVLEFSLDGVLRYLPMAALHDGGRYLIECFALVLSTQAVGAQAQTRSARRAIGLGVTKPVGGHQPLLGVRDELSAVIRTARKPGGVLPGIIRLDRAFTAAALVGALSSQYSVIHVASHFVFTAARDSSSYLLLGDGSKLTLTEFADLRFDAMDLVVLSACNTAIGSGHHQNGHEVEGLGALVRHQGANQVLATLWPVADMTTAALMGGFYRNRYGGGLNAPEALRRAQLSLLQGAGESLAEGQMRCLVDPDEDGLAATTTSADTRHPFYWAPYILMGTSADATA